MNKREREGDGRTSEENCTVQREVRGESAAAACTCAGTAVGSVGRRRRGRRLLGLLLDGELGSQVEHAVEEVEAVLGHEGGPGDGEEVAVAHGLAAGEGVEALVLADEVSGGPGARGELVVNGEADGALLLHAEEEPEAVEGALLVHVAVRGEEESLPAQVKGLRVHAPRGEQVRALLPLEVQVDDALRVRLLELHHLHGAVLVGALHEPPLAGGGLLHGERPLPVGGLRLEEESLQNDLGGQVVVQVGAGQHLPQLAAGHMGEPDQPAETAPEHLPPVLRLRVLRAHPPQDDVVDHVLRGHLQVVAAQDGLDSGQGQRQHLVLEPDSMNP